MNLDFSQSISRDHAGLMEKKLALQQQNFSTLINITLAILAIWYFIVGLRWPDLLLWRFWVIFLMTLGVTSISNRLLRQDQLFAGQVFWLCGLFAVNNLSAYLFGRPELVLLNGLFPLLALSVIGLPAAIIVEILIVAALWGWGFSPYAAFLQPFNGVLIVAGLLATIFGWITEKSLNEEIRDSWQYFQLARQNMVEARQHRAQLLQLFQDLDKAYYRLERANAALVAAWREANEARHQKDQFTTYISHEMRTPLNLIAGFSEMILTSPESYGDAPLPGPYRADINKIFQNARHLLSLVDDVIDLTRANVNKIPLAREPNDLGSIIAESAVMVGDYIRTKGLELRLEVADGLPKLSLDRLRIRQVLLNLLVNAARFTHKGSITLRVTLRPQEALVEVVDTGRGITKEELPQIFEGYHTMDQYDSAWHSGSGLGLPISKSLVELHGGTMGVSSAINQGSTFWFTLPLTAASISEKPAIHSYEVMPYAVKNAERAMVVVHPDPQAVMVLQRFMPGCRLVAAPTADAGLQAVREHNAVATLCEPKTEFLQQDPHLLTLRAPLPSRQAVALRLGAADFLYKPVAAADLLRAIEQASPGARQILIVDDDLEVQQLFRRMLVPRLSAAHCRTASNGMEALEMIEAVAPDVVLLDLHMPQMNGEEILAVMAANPQWRNIPVIVISGEVQDGQMRLEGEITIQRSDGFKPDELGAALKTLVTALTPGWGDSALPREAALPWEAALPTASMPESGLAAKTA